MRIAWFTPFCQESAIGMVSRKVCEELSKTNEIDIWTHNRENLIKTKINVIQFKDKDNLDILKKYDYIVYNMGNYVGNHKDIYEVSQKYSGIVLLHDQIMSSFWEQYYTSSKYGLDGFLNLYNEYYGIQAKEKAIQAINSGCYPTNDYFDNIPKYSFIEPTIKNAIGVFSHAKFFCDNIKKIYNGPVGYTYLPCHIEEIAIEQDSKLAKIISNAKRNNKKVVVSNGIVHPVKQIHKVIEVLEQNSDIARKIIYIVIGNYGGDYGQMLLDYSKGKLKDCLYMMGYQEYSEMNTAIQSADMCINLRYPNSEVCSLSLFEQMAYGKPILVINSGIYGEMPDDTVIKVDYSNIHEDIKDILIKLINNKSFDRFGNNAKAFISHNCSINNYCNSFMQFLESIPNNNALKSIQNNFILSIAEQMKSLGINELSAPATVNTVINNIKSIVNGKCKEKVNLNTIGVWGAFPYKVPDLSREGISRFMGYMIDALIKQYDINVEVWCYSINEEEIRKTFESISNNKISIITEKNYIEYFNPRSDIVELVGDVQKDSDNLNIVARELSKADIMLPMIIYLDNVLGTDKKVFVPAHDMAVSYHYDDFILKDKGYKFRQKDIAARAENLVRNNAVFFSNSNTVRQKQILKFVYGLKEENTKIVYLPVNVPQKVNEHLLSKKMISDKFGIEGRYLFYPTQIRPYKNVQLLIKALAQLVKENSDISLVLTGDSKDVPEVDELINKLNVRKYIIQLNQVSEYELYSIYKYASATPVTSLLEGGFPWQACEALFMNVPLVLADIDVVRERIEENGFTVDNCGFPIFNPYNVNELVLSLKKVLKDREIAVATQYKFAQKLLSYSWSNAAECYYKIFTEM